MSTAGDDVTLFTSVDQTADPQFFVRFMEEGHRLPDIVRSKEIIAAELRLSAGVRVLDVGCGPAIDSLDLAVRVEPGGAVVGVDVSETMIAAARARTRSAAAPIRFELGSADALPFGDAEFDACKAERVFMHLHDPTRALSEMVRVTCPGGRICVFDFDWHTLLIDHPVVDTTDMVVRSVTDSMASGRIGRQLQRMFVNAGLSDVTVRLHPVRLSLAFSELLLGGHLARLQRESRLPAKEARSWWDELTKADSNGALFIALTACIASATR